MVDATRRGLSQQPALIPETAIKPINSKQSKDSVDCLSFHKDKDSFKSNLTELKHLAESVVAGLPKYFKEVVDKFVGDLFVQLNRLPSFVFESTSRITTCMKNFIGKIIKSVSNCMHGLLNGSKEGLQKLASRLVAFVDNLRNSLSGFMDKRAAQMLTFVGLSIAFLVSTVVFTFVASNPVFWVATASLLLLMLFTICVVGRRSYIGYLDSRKVT